MNIKRVLTTVDTHTAGGPTRTVVAGLPPLSGTSVAAKMDDFRNRHDALRKLLLCEPRGHRDMYGAVLTPPGDPEAALGAFFLTSAGYLRACVHSSIGLATAGLETGFIGGDSMKPDGSIPLETPAGVVSLFPQYEGSRLESIAIRTRPAFLYAGEAALQGASANPLEVSLVYSGVFFVLLDVAQPGADFPKLAPENAASLASIGMELLAAANRQFEVRHPENPDLRSLDLIMLYENVGDRQARDIVIGRSGSVDRSPCGAGAGAKMVLEHSRGRLTPGEEYVLDSFLGTRFLGKLVQPCHVGPHHGAIPEIRGAAHVTGVHQFVLDPHDPLQEGFLF
jgi:proline racemase